MAGEHRVTSYEHLNYFDGLFLKEADFTLEQRFHVRARRYLNYLLFNPGRLLTNESVDPLNVTATGTTITVSAGAALVRDDARREAYEVHLDDPVELDLSSSTFGLSTGDSVRVALEFGEEERNSGSGSAGGAGVLISGNDRVAEQVVIRLSTPADPPSTQPFLPLADVDYQDSMDNSNVTNTPGRGGIRFEILSQDLLDRIAGPAPVLSVTGFNPASGPVGTVVEIDGTSFTGATNVAFGGAGASFVVTSPVRISATVPAGAASGPITVATPAGTASSPSAFIVAAPPAINDFDPVNGPAGTTVVIRGANFNDTTEVRFNGVSAIFEVDTTGNAIQTDVPAGATTGPITVVTPAGTATSATDFEVIAPVPAPVFRDTSDGDQILDRAGFAGSTEVRIFCSNFFEGDPRARSISFGGVPLDPIQMAAITQIPEGIENVQVPAAASGRVFVTLVNEGGTATSTHDFNAL